MARVAGGGGRGRVDHCFMALLKSGRLALLASDKYHSLCSVDPPRRRTPPPSVRRPDEVLGVVFVPASQRRHPARRCSPARPRCFRRC